MGEVQNGIMSVEGNLTIFGKKYTFLVIPASAVPHLGISHKDTHLKIQNDI